MSRIQVGTYVSRDKCVMSKLQGGDFSPRKEIQFYEHKSTGRNLI